MHFGKITKLQRLFSTIYSDLFSKVHFENEAYNTFEQREVLLNRMDHSIDAQNLKVSGSLEI